MGLWGSAGLARGLGRAGSAYAEGLKEAENLKTQKLQNKLIKMQSEKAEADAAAVGLDAEFANAASSLNYGLAAPANTNVSDGKSENEKGKVTEGIGGGQPGSTEIKPADSNIPPKKDGEPSQNETPGVEIPDENAIPGLTENPDDKKFVQDKTQVDVSRVMGSGIPDIDKPKPTWRDSYKQNMDAVSKSVEIKKAKQQNASKNLVKGMPGYNPVADEEEPMITSESGNLEKLDKKIDKLQPMKDIVSKQVTQFLEMEKKTGNKFYGYKAKEIQAKYGSKIREYENKYYLDAIKMSAEMGDVSAVNTLSSILGLTGGKNQTFDYDEETGNWSLMNGNAKTNFSTKEISLFLTDTEKFADLQRTIREEKRKSDLAVQEAVNKFNALTIQPGQVSDAAKEFARRNIEKGKLLTPENGRMIIDTNGVFGLGAGTPIFVTTQEYEALKSGKGDYFDENGRFKRPDGTAVVEINKDYFKDIQVLTYDPSKITNTYYITGGGTGGGGNGGDGMGKR